MNLLRLKFIHASKFALDRMWSLGGYPCDQTTFVPHNRDTARFKRGNGDALIDDVASDDNFATVE